MAAAAAPTGVPTSVRRGLAFACIYLLWGSQYLGISLMVDDIPPYLGAGFRYLICGGLLAGWIARRDGRRALRVSRRQMASMLLLGLLLISAGAGFVTVAEQHITSSLAALLLSSVPLWLIAFAIAARQPVPRVVLLSAVVGFVGVAALVLPGGQDGSVSILGAVLVLLGAVAFAGGSWISPYLDLPPDFLVAVVWQMLLGGSVLVLTGLVAGELAQVHVPTWSATGGFLYITLISSLFGYSSYGWLLRNAPIRQVSTFAYVNPVVAILLGWAFHGEHISPMTLVASALILSSVAISLRVEADTPPPPES